MHLWRHHIFRKLGSAHEVGHYRSVTNPSPLQPYTDAELILGLVSPVGTDLGKFEATLQEALSDYRYETNSVRVSDLALKLVHAPAAPDAERYADRVSRLMDAGNKAREKFPSALALAVAAAINSRRETSGDLARPLLRTAHVVRSLKNPEEVLAMRRIYGGGFYLLGVVTSEDERTEHLKSRRGCSKAEIADLRARDDYEGLRHGQRTRDTFHLADAFISLSDSKELHRFLDLIFSAPHVTPNADEHAMFLAFAAALRSADLSRQVGAVIVSEKGDVIAVGANDVPKEGGGLFWPGPKDQRDFVQGLDFNEVERREIIDDVLDRLRPDDVDPAAWRARGQKELQGAAIFDITEYGRPVHAEMDALIAAGRAGVSARGGTLYCTTFPCHNCAKHLLAAGLRRVVYVEPYPKSRTQKLYKSSVRFAASEEPDERLLFEPFRGIGPRRFFDLFSMNLGAGYSVKRKDESGRARSDWTPSVGEARVPLLPASYMVREDWAAAEIARLFGPSEGDCTDGQKTE